VPQLPGKAPISKRFEEAVGLTCESAAGRRVAQQFKPATVGAIDLRYLQRWAAARRKPTLRQLLPDATELQLNCLKFELDTVVLIVRTARREAVCPLCHQPSCRANSHYERKLADLPWHGNKRFPKVQSVTKRGL
jgi:hypothetical protein